MFSFDKSRTRKRTTTTKMTLMTMKKKAMDTPLALV
jgi:hypothetical protein